MLYECLRVAVQGSKPVEQKPAHETGALLLKPLVIPVQKLSRRFGVHNRSDIYNQDQSPGLLCMSVKQHPHQSFG